MPFLVLMLFPLWIVSIIYVRYRLTRSRPSDYEAIDELVLARGLTRISLRNDNNYWVYWIRGRTNLSNCARIYIIEAQDVNGEKRQIHVAFDDWSARIAKLQVLMEK